MKRIVLDIETVPAVISDLMEADEIKKMSLDATIGRIACVGAVLIDDFKPIEANVFISDDEPAILREFWSYIAQNKCNRFITHNGLHFDMPYLWRRSVIAKVKPSIDLDLRKYRTDPIYDTMSVWGNWESRGFVSLDALSRALSVGSKSGSGSDVFELWRQGDLSAIANYCLDDCWLTYACYCRMNFTEPQPRTTQQQIRIPHEHAEFVAGSR
jgi:hypothetical protein